ncbi:MAG: hypothetical protein AABX52_02395, partial [Nanoarchaeota archaeon]
LDPQTAHNFVEALNTSTRISTNTFSFTHLICTALEIQPLLHVRTKEFDIINQKTIEYMPHLLVLEPSLYDPDYERFLDTIKTALMLTAWMDEQTEQHILETYDTRPGETRTKLDNATWLLYCLLEIGRVIGTNKKTIHEINKTRIRLKYGIKEEIIPLVKFKGIGRIRARKLYTNNIRSISDIKRTDLTTLSQLVGTTMARLLKEQVGEPTPTPPSPLKRKGQLGLGRYQ